MGGTRTNEPYRLLIGGEWVDGSGGRYGIVNPATERLVGEAPEATVADAEAAASAAKEALGPWSRTTPAERAQLLSATADALRARAEHLLPLIMAETGATLSVGSALQIPQAYTRFDRYARISVDTFTVALPPQEIATTPLAPGGLMGAVALRQPVGVVACISPYNFPVVNMAGKIAPALAAGNTVIMKPAPQDPLAVIELAAIMNEVGFPPGVVNVLTGARPEVGAALVENRDVDMISFTGSTTVGQRIFEAGAKTMKRLLMELGGKGACLVLDDADLDAALGCLTSVWAFHSGQICTAPTRALVHRSRYDEVVGRLSALAPQLKIGDPTRADTVVGPVISAAQRGRIEEFIRIGAKDGGNVLVDGSRPPGLETGYYVGPTLIADCSNEMTVVREEVFGPVIVVVPFDDDDEAIAMANDSDYGLYDYVFSRDAARAYRAASELRCGHVGINTAQRNHEAPFGGFKLSGVGRDGGDFGIHAYTELQSIIWPS